jgi:hypothetical protein
MDIFKPTRTLRPRKPRSPPRTAGATAGRVHSPPRNIVEVPLAILIVKSLMLHVVLHTLSRCLFRSKFHRKDSMMLSILEPWPGG